MLLSALWDHQQQALTTLRRYLESETHSKAALVSMPTGTGKSAVIATLLADPTIDANQGSALVLTPWKSLSAQLAADIDDRVWAALGVARPVTLPPIVRVRSAADFIAKSQGAGRRIYVTTMAMALEIYKRVGKDAIEMGSLFADFGAVIVDECHYEPAPTWSEAVRATGLPTCLLTATPFRNDNRYFALDESAQYRYGHAEAIADQVLRRPEFLELARESSEREFVASLLQRLEALPLEASDRVVIRCGDRSAVEAMTRALITAGETAVGFHETFSASERDAGLMRSVPAPADRPDVRFLVHQHKLTEGFDDPSAKVLVVYDSFGSDRARVQQVGRVLRNPLRALDAKAWVIATNSQMADAWGRYERFDRVEAPRAVATDPAGIEALLSAQPETFYWDRLFREKFDLHNENAWQHVKFRFSASIRVAVEQPDLDSLAENVREDHVERDRRVLSIGTPNAESRVILHLTVENSPVLRTGAFVEMTLGYTVLHWDGKRLFVVDSTSSVPKSVSDRTDPIGAKSLIGLLPDGARISDVSLANNDLSQWSLRTRSLGAFDLATVASEIGDTTFGYATAEGHLVVGEDQVTRYTGIRNGRVTDHRNTEGAFEDLARWFVEIGATLDAKRRPATAVDRYASPVPQPAAPRAAHALLDIDVDQFEGFSDSKPISVELYGGEVDSGGNFLIAVNGKDIEAHIAWNSESRRFELSANEPMPFRTRFGARNSFWSEVNRHQTVRVATSEGLVYTNGNFWSLARRDGAASSGLLSLLTGHAALATLKSEKGPVDADGKWSRDCAFGLIDLDLLPEAFDSDATILCTDLGTEIADFIGFTDKKVVFVHAKSKSAASKSTISASALHEVVSQAVKNLRYLTVGNVDQPATGTLAGTWKGAAHGNAPRLRAGTSAPNGKGNWRRINNAVQSHSTEREVWLVLGASLSKSALEEELSRSRPRAVAVQALALLTSAWTATQQCGVRLRILCSP